MISVCKAEACVCCGATVLFVAEGGFPFREHQCEPLSSLSGFQSNCVCLNDVFCSLKVYEGFLASGVTSPFHFISAHTVLIAAVLCNIMIILCVFNHEEFPLACFWSQFLCVESTGYQMHALF